MKAFRDLAARALTPLLLISIALLLRPIGQYANSMGCQRATSAHWLERTQESSLSGIDGRLQTLGAWIGGSADAAAKHFQYVFFLTIGFALAYLLVAREPRALRVAVFTAVILAGFVAGFLGSIC
jgi:hypothetical protein